MSARRGRERLLAVLVPLTAAGTALLALSAWSLSGQAGAPSHVTVANAQVWLTYLDGRDTSAYFTLRNTGDTDDRLVAVSSPRADHVMLSRHEHTATGAGRMAAADTLGLPARSTVRMSATTVNVMLTPREHWAEGGTVEFVLRFEHAPQVTVTATVVRPGTPTG
ncbi:copper chaperone PCu(A)C [Streptomyces sp. NPDC049881]|uniref:copper chaperone PCu(A)C n=1 Tax=Streptomyces sp. NPDC049881 TaxID=3155778 RepID=UPI003436908B